MVRIPRPPPPTGGHGVGPPDYLGVGAQKSGTSWWHSLIQEHPQVYRPQGLLKEVHFLDAMGPLSTTSERLDTHRYHQYFPRPPGMVVGEWTPRYLHDFWVPPLLPQMAPSVQVLVLLRDPVERFRSGLTLSLELSGGRNQKILANDAFTRGMYWSQLTWLWRWVEPAKVLVLQYEKCVREPLAELERTYRFLGIDPGFAPDNLTVEVNPTVVPKIRLDPQMRRWLRFAYANEVAALTANLPDFDARLWHGNRG